MRTLRRLFGILLLALVVSTPAVADPYSAIYVFGDSLSDSGNAHAGSAGTYPPDPPYYKGRFSNGPTWAENVAAHFGLKAESFFVGGTNYAFGGALTDGASPYGTPSLKDQVGIHLAGGGGMTDSKGLHIVWSGANDPLLGGATDPMASAKNVKDAIEALAKGGAKEFLVANMPSLGETPELKGGPMEAGANLFSAGFNLALEGELAGLEGMYGVKIHRFDANSLFTDMLTDPTKYGFTNVTSDALTDGVYTGEGYLFWDTVHPTAEGHRYLAEAAINTLRSPEPTSLALALTAGVGVWWVRRRRKPEEAVPSC